MEKKIIHVKPGAELPPIEVPIIEINGQEYISLTALLKAKPGATIDEWLRNKSTIEFLGEWESLENPDFNYGVYAVIKKQPYDKNQKLSVKSWAESTGAIGIVSKTGKYGGTYARKDIAVEFCMWISAGVKLQLIREWRKFREKEYNPECLEWNLNRFLTKANYTIQTDAVKDYKIPFLSPRQLPFAYTDEANLINIVVFGMTATKWREANVEQVKLGKNMRDFASINELLVISNLESLNAQLIKGKIAISERFKMLKEVFKEQMATLERINLRKSFKRTVEGGFQALYKDPRYPNGMFPQKPFGELANK